MSTINASLQNNDYNVKISINDDGTRIYEFSKIKNYKLHPRG
jgi:hypothetical protein